MFRDDKATQLAAYLIQKAGGRCKYILLIKMMYDADREMVLRWGTPILFDRWVAMKAGPVLSETYNEIKRSPDSPDYWSSHITTIIDPDADIYDVQLKSDPGTDALSDAELGMADKGFDDFREMDHNQAIKRAHELFKEWKDPAPGKVHPISYKDVLIANGQGDPEYLNEVRAHCQLNELFAR